jgi:prepilin-type N-terminal cleavage/methylation domain-containing protein
MRTRIGDVAVEQRTYSRKRSGFTILELLVVFTIAGVLIGITGKGLASAFAGNSRSSAVRVAGTTLFQARTQPLRDQKGNPVPCEFCKDLRFKGRTGVFELLVVTDEIRDGIVGQPSTRRIAELARATGMTSLQADGWAKAHAGITTVEEVLRVTDH